MGTAAPIIMAVASVAATGLAAYSAYQQGQAGKQQAQYQQQVAAINEQTAQRNRALAEANARYTESAGAGQMDDRARRVRQVVGSQRAAIASNGLLVNEGSGLDLTDDTAELGGLAISEIRDNAARGAQGYRIAGVNASGEATAASLRGQAYSAAGNDAARAGMIGAGSTILGGGVQAYDRWDRMRSTGVKMPAANNVIGAP